MIRPRPPEHLTGIDGALDGKSFVPAPDLVTWFSETFIAPGAPLENPDHAHLQFAAIGALWTNVANSRHGRSVVGQAEQGKNVGGTSAGKWGKARAEQQVEEWFGTVPDFILTFDAAYAEKCSDAEFMCLVEHELSHCGQERDEFGAPRFLKSGLPALCMRAHDVETFVGLAARYGAVEANVERLMDALSRPPSVAAVDITGVCGTCLARAA